MNAYRYGLLLAALTLFISAGAVTAQPVPPPSQAYERIATQIGRMVIQIESDADKIRELQSALAAKQKELDDLRAKVDQK